MKTETWFHEEEAGSTFENWTRKIKVIFRMNINNAEIRSLYGPEKNVPLLNLLLALVITRGIVCLVGSEFFSWYVRVCARPFAGVVWFGLVWFVVSLRGFRCVGFCAPCPCWVQFCAVNGSCPWWFRTWDSPGKNLFLLGFFLPRGVFVCCLFVLHQRCRFLLCLVPFLVVMEVFLQGTVS